MRAIISAVYSDTFTILRKWTGDDTRTGRQLAHAMAHSYYGCRDYVIFYHETDGSFSVIHS